MAKNLVIVESPAKAKTINKILGKDYLVKASIGHVRDLPPKKLGVDVEKDFSPEYVTIRGKAKLLTELKKDAKSCEKVFLAPDPDREGEAIAWHLYEVLKTVIDEEKIYRVTYNEITKSAILNAFSNPSRININRVNSQQARRVLDRLVGYKVSPLLWKQIKGGSSAGRVQSVALRLICEREKEIEAFVPQEYWNLGADVRKFIEPRDPFHIKLVKVNDKKADITNGEEAAEIEKNLKNSKLIVKDKITKEVKRRAKPPFITSSMQQGASSFYGFTPKRTMGIAQKLYEAGHITYMRTDSFHIAKGAQESCLEFIKNSYGSEYIPENPNFYKSRGSAQEAHEAIRPTDVNKKPEAMKGSLSEEEFKLYKLIWSRFVASQMVPAKISRLTVEIENESGKDNYLFRVTTSEIIFPGYMKASGIEAANIKNKKDDKDDNLDVEKLPELSKGENLECVEFHSEQKFTKPPARFTEASLIKTLEENGVGRPSTYAQTLSTIEQRQYVEKENRSLKPTEAGIRVYQFLIDNPDYPKLNILFNVKFTAEMEEELDKIESGDIEWTKMMDEFYSTLKEGIKHPEANPEFLEKTLSLLENVKKWAEPVKQNRRTYDDEKMFNELKEKFKNGEPVSKRQGDALFAMACRYEDQIPELKKMVEEMGLQEAYNEAKKKAEPPKPETLEKLKLMENIEYDEPRKVGNRKYDDKKFVKSLTDQAKSGRKLTENQINYLHKLIIKYKSQIPDYEKVAEELGINAAMKAVDDPSVGEILKLMEYVKEWNPPVKRGRREFDDKSFYNSLSTQYESKGSLTPRQLAALKKMVARYGTIIPDYEELMKKYELPVAKKPKIKKETEDKKVTRKKTTKKTAKKKSTKKTTEKKVAKKDK